MYLFSQEVYFCKRSIAYPQSNDQPRDVIVNRANSLTVASEVPMRTQNGTEFRMGATAPETAENILRALTPNSLRNVLNRFTNQNTTNDEMKEAREERNTNNARSSQGGGFFSMFNPFTWFGGSK